VVAIRCNRTVTPDQALPSERPAGDGGASLLAERRRGIIRATMTTALLSISKLFLAARNNRSHRAESFLLAA
jgi:hypothetical protein